jgi:hypothetical protein
VEIEHLLYESVTGDVLTTRPAESDLIVICEGDSDRVVIAALAERILRESGSRRTIKIIAAMGKFTIPRVANAVLSTGSTAAQTLIVLDADGDPEACHRVKIKITSFYILSKLNLP